MFSTVFLCKDFAVSGEVFGLKKCNSCLLSITSPSPALEDLPRYYQSQQYISHTSKATSLINSIYLLVRSVTIKSKLKLITKALAPGQKKSVLDYGCGTGTFLKKCKSNGWSISGVEPAPDARKLAQQNCGQEISTSLQEIGTRQFQIITLWHVLEHIPDFNEVLNTLTQKLATDGTLIIAVPNPNSWDAKHYQDCWAGYDIPRHLWHFSQANIERLLNTHGLNLTAKIPMRFDSYYVSMLSEKYRQNKTTLTGLFKAVIKGTLSNHYAKKSTEYSSLIYLAKK
jgi:2-polyprenyl-3-methyl-5-hydroxy-6-metoxy-1,4-benzoquinol methylase